MSKLWEYNFWYSFWRKYVDLCTRMSYSHIKVEGLENIPDDAAVILAPNHCTTLMDALVILQVRKGITVFGARADLFKNKTAASILRWLRIVPLARSRDGASEVAKNYAVFDEVSEVLFHNIPFCIFAEGTHRPEREVQPIRKGVFRIAELARQHLDKPLYIVPVGLDFDDFFEYMSGVTIRYGQAMDASEFEGGDSRELTEMLRRKIQELSNHRDESKPVISSLALRILLAVLIFPIVILNFVISSPILLLTLLVKRKIKDRAWINTIRFGCRLPFIIFWPFHSGFYYMMNFYKKLINSRI